MGKWRKRKRQAVNRYSSYRRRAWGTTAARLKSISKAGSVFPVPGLSISALPRIFSGSFCRGVLNDLFWCAYPGVLPAENRRAGSRKRKEGDGQSERGAKKRTEARSRRSAFKIMRSLLYSYLPPPRERIRHSLALPDRSSHFVLDAFFFFSFRAFYRGQ